MQATLASAVTFRPILPREAVFLPVHVLQKRSSIIPAGHPFSNREEQACPPGWVPFTHPNGATYYYSQDLHVVTYLNPISHRDLQILSLAHRTIVPRMIAEVAGVAQPDPPDLLLHVMPNSRTVGYCLIDHGSRNLFWLRDEVPQHSNGMTFQDDFPRTAQYWSFVKQFPCHRRVELSIRELVGVLSQGAMNEMMIPDSLFPFDAARCRSMLELMRSELDYDCTDYTISHSTWSAATIWEIIEEHCHYIRCGTHTPLFRIPLFGHHGIVWVGPHPSVLYVPPRPLLSPISWTMAGMLILHQHWERHKIALLLGNTALLLHRRPIKEPSLAHCSTFIIVLTLLSHYLKRHSIPLCRAFNLGRSFLGLRFVRYILALDATLLAGILHQSTGDVVTILLTIATFTWIFVQQQGAI